MHDCDDWYGQHLLPLAEQYVRAAVYESPKLDLPPDILLAAVIDVWARLRDEIVGQDVLELARAIALRIPPVELTEEPGISDEHIREIAEHELPAPQPGPQPRRGIWGTGPRDGQNNHGLFRA